jgi:DNA-binding FadR family transcriptional regulator
VPRKSRSAEEEAQSEENVAQEFFYTHGDREDAIRHDARLHNRILREADNPVDEEIMGPIREKHRKKWLREQRGKRR